MAQSTALSAASGNSSTSSGLFPRGDVTIDSPSDRKTARRRSPKRHRLCLVPAMQESEWLPMQYDSRTNLELSCLKCEYCHSCRADSDIFCKHPFVVSAVEGTPVWRLGDIGHQAWLTPGWCPGPHKKHALYNIFAVRSSPPDHR